MSNTTPSNTSTNALETVRCYRVNYRQHSIRVERMMETIQCYRVNADGTYQRFYLGCMRLDLHKWCQEKADTHQQQVIMDNNGTPEVFKPVSA